MNHESPVLYYPIKKTRGDSLYSAARREIFERAGQMPRIIDAEPDLGEFFEQHPNAELYIPVFIESRGWWGGLLGAGDIQIVDKIILSADCHLMVIKSNHESRITNHLFAAEIRPSSQFFKKMNSSIATSLDMLATDTGAVLGLFAGRNPAKFKSLVESTGNQYLGCIGGY